MKNILEELYQPEWSPENHFSISKRSCESYLSRNRAQALWPVTVYTPAGEQEVEEQTHAARQTHTTIYP